MPIYQSTPFTIFIVDDSQIIVDRLLQMLPEEANAAVAGYAYDAFTALLAIDELKPDAVLLDIQLKNHSPAASGLNILSMLRKAYPVMAIIMLTNLAAPGYKNRCLRLGADYFLDKSYDFGMIPEIVKKIQEVK